MLNDSRWITAPEGVACPLFRRAFRAARPIARATLRITARGVYEAVLNGARVGAFVLAPGWTEYEERIQVQSYDVTALLAEENVLDVTLAPGWYLGRIASNPADTARRGGLIASLRIAYADGTAETIVTDESWLVGESGLRRCDIWDGQCYDASFVPHPDTPAAAADFPHDVLVAQVGEEVRAQETIRPCRFFMTPKGERVADFGQNLTGAPQISLTAKAGERVALSFAEVLDADGNFYTENYRSAKAEFTYICRDGQQTYRPTLTFYGFRYVRIDEFPAEATLETLSAVVYHSAMRRTGFVTTDDPLVNRLFSNVIWGQKGNYLDVPTDCPQRDERLGWTGDAEVFCRAAAYNFDVRRFFRKWLGDMRLAQRPDGSIPHVIPVTWRHGDSSAAWADAATIIPWQLWETYGDVTFLEDNFEMMHRWVDYITAATTSKYQWHGGKHFADWLGLDAPYGQYKGSTDPELIADAYYAASAERVVRAGEAIGRDVAAYRALHENIVRTFRETYRDTFPTQTGHALALRFGLAADPAAVAASLAAMVRRDGERLMTGFVGTPYILHALSDNGYAELAYTLLLRREFPSWLYPVTQGATTMWEHWDGVTPDGRLWSRDMNSFNHYAYGAAADWLYEKAGGITPLAPGFARVRFAPLPDARLGALSVRFDSPHGTIESAWRVTDGVARYRLVTPVPAVAEIGGARYDLTPGAWEF